MWKWKKQKVVSKNNFKLIYFFFCRFEDTLYDVSDIHEHLEVEDSIPKEDNKKNKETNFICICFFFFIFIFIFLLVLIVILYKKLSKKKEIKKNKIKERFFKSDGHGYIEESFKIPNEGDYEICLCGASALEGGKGGFICAKHNFTKNNIIDFRLEGRSAGGKGGKNCGCYLCEKGSGKDGAGLARAIKKNFKNEFELVAGGGGGNAEGTINKGGDCEEDGNGSFGGKGATISRRGKKGKNGAKDGKKYKGGDGEGNGGLGDYCGGGGGNGYYGGGGGGIGNEKEAGGGGGGSNYCKAKECHIDEINRKYYSCYIIYNFTVVEE